MGIRPLSANGTRKYSAVIISTKLPKARSYVSEVLTLSTPQVTPIAIGPVQMRGKLSVRMALSGSEGDNHRIADIQEFDS